MCYPRDAVVVKQGNKGVRYSGRQARPARRKDLDSPTPLVPIAIPDSVSDGADDNFRPDPPLTVKEEQIRGWVAEGKRDAEIAKIFGTSVHTVKTQMKKILGKAHLENRGALIAWIWRTRIAAQKREFEKRLP